MVKNDDKATHLTRVANPSSYPKRSNPGQITHRAARRHPR